MYTEPKVILNIGTKISAASGKTQPEQDLKLDG